MPLELVASEQDVEPERPRSRMSTLHRSGGTELGERLVEVVLPNGRCLRVCPAIDEASLARLIRVLEGV